jgi:hypothetical protein
MPAQPGMMQHFNARVAIIHVCMENFALHGTHPCGCFTYIRYITLVISCLRVDYSIPDVACQVLSRKKFSENFQKALDIQKFMMYNVNTLVITL